MKKMLAMMLFIMFLVSLAALPAFAVSNTVDAENKLCPISGEPVSGTSFVEYQGKRYGLCCPMCEALFLKDPEKYMAQMKLKEKETASSVPATSAASKEMEKDMEQGSF